MTTEITEQVIRDLLKEVYGCEYTGEIKVQELIKDEIPYGTELRKLLLNRQDLLNIIKLLENEY